jgi:polysaccharide biosynthesis protein PslH
MSKLLLVTTGLNGAAPGGRAQLSRLHHDCLKSLLGERLFVHDLDPGPIAGLASGFRALQGYIDGLSPDVEQAILNRIEAQGISRVFLNGSNLGHIAAFVKSRSPRVEVFTFFHNVEARFFWGALKQRPGLRALGVLAANHRAEMLAVRHSDRLITLSKRDSDGLRRLYGREATDLLPMALADRLDSDPRALGGASQGDYVLFVGGAFYANEAGITWFAQNVAPSIGIRTCVVGLGMERRRADLERANVNVVGRVDALEPWYLDAKAVIAPIFDGSGMKTKVAEALMFGKRVVGTSEAFSGYEAIADRVGRTCDDAQSFISAIRELEALELPRLDPELRALYERHHSANAAIAGLRNIIG